MLIVSPITVYDNDHELWETYIGSDEKGMPLLLSVWGETEEESRGRAELILDILR